MNGWWLVGIAAPLVLLWARLGWSLIHSLIAALIGWAAISASWSPVGPDAIDALWKMILGLVLFCIGFEIANVDRFYRLAGMVLIPSALLAIGQDLPATGLFGNPNMMGEAAALVIVGLVASGDGRSWMIGAAILPVLILSQARGALLAVLLLLAGHRSVIVVVLVCAAALFLLPLHRDFLAPNSMIERATIWSDTVSQLTFFGHGLGSYAESLHSTLSSRVVEHAHNDFLELAFELGVPGAAIGALIIGAVFISAATNERLVLGALGIEAMFGFPFHAPATAVIGLVVAGHAVRSWDQLWWGSGSGRTAFRGWHGVAGDERESV